MACKTCDSERLARVNAKCNDLCIFSMGNYDVDGYVPNNVGIGGGDYVSFLYCLHCGQIQDRFPVTPEHVEEALGIDG